MKLKSTLAAALLAFGAVGAQANVTDWGVHGNLEFGLNITAGNFTDYFLFEITPTPYTVSSTAVANNLGNGVIWNIANGQYSVWSYGSNGTFESGSGDDVKLSGDFGFNGATGNVTNAVLLNPGKYYYQVSGNANGQFGGSYSISSTIAPVPEPETAAMLLAGLGALGFLARRRSYRD